MLPLIDKTIVVTRPREQAGELKRALEQLGARVVLFPTIEIAEPESYDELDRAIENLFDYDWLVFTSANAVEHFLRRFERQNLEIADLDFLLVCAVGEATAERLRLGQIHLDVIPIDGRAEGVFAALADYLGGAENFEGVRFLLPRSEIARDYLPVKLRAAGAAVTAPVAYRTILPGAPETGKLKALLQGGAIDVVTFTSPSTFKNFCQFFAGENLTQLFAGAAIACIGETTAQTIGERGLPAQIVSAEASNNSLARAVADYFSSNG